MENEIWKDIEDFEGLYQVSNLGRVLSMRKGKVMALTFRGCGYLGVTFHKDGKSYQRLVHRMVGRAFVEGWFDGAVINHKDEDKTNNRASNLEWVTVKENINYGTHTQRQRETLRPTFKPVVMKTTDGKVLREFDSVREAERQTGIARDPIRRCCEHQDRYFTAGGYVWEYKHNEKETARPVPERRKAVVQMSLDGTEIATFASAGEAEKATGINASSIKHCCQGRHKTIKGYKWKYKDEET